MLKLENISQIYAKGNEPVLKGINFEIKTGDYIALEGCIGKWEKYTFVHYGRINAPDRRKSIVEK